MGSVRRGSGRVKGIMMGGLYQTPSIKLFDIIESIDIHHAGSQQGIDHLHGVQSRGRHPEGRK